MADWKCTCLFVLKRILDKLKLQFPEVTYDIEMVHSSLHGTVIWSGSHGVYSKLHHNAHSHSNKKLVQLFRISNVTGSVDQDLALNQTGWATTLSLLTLSRWRSATVSTRIKLTHPNSSWEQVRNAIHQPPAWQPISTYSDISTSTYNASSSRIRIQPILFTPSENSET